MPDHIRAQEKALIAELGYVDDALISNATEAQRAATAIERQGIYPFDAPQNRSVTDARIFGVRIGDLPESEWCTRSADHIEDTGYETAPVMLASAKNGSRLIGRVTTFPFGRSRGLVPVAPRLTAFFQARNEALTPATPSVYVHPFDALKAAAVVTTVRENIEDWPHALPGIEAALIDAVGQRVDYLLVRGGSDGDTTVEGLLTAGVTTAPATAGTIVLSDVLNAVGRVTDAGATANAVLMSAQGKAKFVAANSQAVGAGILPEIIALPKLGDGTAIIADDVCIAVDLSAVAVAIRKDIEVTMTTTSPEVFMVDRVAVGARARIGSVTLGDAGHAQVIATA